jgi:7-carboxy-7-deazaguanine synthase
MNISEIFYSIQGESTYSGLPCVFVRTAGCNLNCAYCDTKYASETRFKLTSEEILRKIRTFKHTNLVEITGGEPLLQKDINALFKLLNDNNFKILLETNGSIDLKTVPEYVCKIVDIKTPSSGHRKSFILSNLNYIDTEKDNLKFVISNLYDYAWMKDFLKKHQLSGQHILVSTVSNEISPQTIAKKILHDGLNVRFQLQIHKYIWGNKAGV